MESDIYKAEKEAREIWDEFCRRIMYENRYFVEDDILAKIKYIIKYSSCSIGIGISDDFNVYRARIGNYLDKDENEMRSPQIGISSDGRGNPRGISYFYTSNDADTAIHEVRPYKGSEITVATFKLRNQLHVIDFRAIEIWEKGMKKSIPLSIIERSLLNCILEDLSKPISPDKALEYIPLQYIIEYIKTTKKDGFSYDGIKYKSTLAEGFNYLFFNDKHFEFIESKLYTITDANYSYSECESEDLIK